MHPSGHPMAVLRPEAERIGCVSSAELQRHVGERVPFAGVLSALRRLVDARGEVMQFATLEDEHGLVEATLFSAELARLGDPLRHPGPYWISATVSEEHGVLGLWVHEVRPFVARPEPWRRLRMRVTW